jgi:predicted nucleotidyltransferase
MTMERLSLSTEKGIALYIQDMVRDQKLPEGIQQKIKALTSRVAAVDEVVAFFLFGSAARDELKPLSDMDFAVLVFEAFPVKASRSFGFV